jgi:hypothetical protein
MWQVAKIIWLIQVSTILFDQQLKNVISESCILYFETEMASVVSKGILTFSALPIVVEVHVVDNMILGFYLFFSADIDPLFGVFN